MAKDTRTTLPGASADDPFGIDRDEATLATERTSLAGSSATAREVAATEVIPLVEETVRVGKREVKGGAVRVRTEVDTVEELARAELHGEKVEVTRVPVNREIDRAPEIRTENGVTVIPVIEEILVVEKRLVLKEELHIRRQETTESVEVPVTVRRQRAVVERVTPDGKTRSEEIE